MPSATEGALLVLTELVTLIRRTLLCAAISCSAISSAELLPFVADYQAHYNGMEVSASRQLQRDGDSYREQLSMRSLLGSVDELSHFSLDANHWPRPHSSRYSLSLLGINRDERQQFDWQALEVDYRRGDKQRRIALEPHCLDLTTHRTALVADLRQRRESLDYCVINRGKRKQYRYTVVGEERIDTALGALNTLHVRRQRDADESRNTELWLAIDWDFLLVRLHQFEEDEEYRLELTSATVAQRPVAALPQTLNTPLDSTGN